MTAVAEKETALSGKSVLVIEDDALLHTLLIDNLGAARKKGIDVKVITDAEEGLATAKRIHPDLILLDLLLPGMSGFEFLEALRKDPSVKDTRVIVLSNLNQESDREKAKELGAEDYLVKADVSLADIVGRIESALQ